MKIVLIRHGATKGNLEKRYIGRTDEDLCGEGIKKLKEELKSLTVADLQSQLVDAKKELFNLRFQNATNQLDNTARIKEVRKNIARIQTVITEKASVAE